MACGIALGEPAGAASAWSWSKRHRNEVVPLKLADLIDALTDSAAYPFAVENVEVRQTHISAVFLAGSLVYKIKKPVDFGFLDFRTLAQRRHFCEEEVRLNRRLAPHVYLGVVPVTRDADGACLEGDGEVVEWAVKMQRLPEGATLWNRLQAGRVQMKEVRTLAQKIAAFHDHAASGPHISAGGRFEVVAGNARDNFTQSAASVGVTVSHAVFSRAEVLVEESLARLQPLIESRADRDMPRDTHGDLRLDHIYRFPDREPPGDLVIIDCIEFNERFRFADPVSDMAFLLMELRLQGHRDLASAFGEAYFHASCDDEGRSLLCFYTAYRAMVRAKVEGLRIGRAEINDADQQVALAKSRALWLLALGELEPPRRKPCLVLVAGLPGSGKSTLARELGDRENFEVIRTDVVRKELAGAAGLTTSSEFGDGIYSPEWTEQTYAECLRRAKEFLFQGKRVLVDGNFREERWRGVFLDTAGDWGVPGRLLVCQASPGIVRARLQHRRKDASDADWSVYLKAQESWEEPGPRTHALLQVLDADGPREQLASQATAALRRRELSD
ncbi:bifunctional aminoglycoside phosphotransferase/ATP-binding protein [Lignipirellula cremea]|uniref:Zeta toxin n=1 Tax=Lignipirellula cremea TaxID=2528010 RepID=A0A518E472_9BACT|nr:AAA family ATPase [Lignipirellula cremea]QDU98882.1 Zeta toxin [Lignipirellula cremea]